MQERIPRDVYSRCTILAKSYYVLIARRRELARDILLSSPPPSEGMPRSPGAGDPTARKAERLIACTAELDRKINAIHRALDDLPDETARAFIRKNLFDRIPMIYIDLPIAEIGMKRTRRAFVLSLAKHLNEI